ncbi:MAG: S8 family serine peptidase [Nitrospira sp.]|nr:S8 family serine peptidase [Nitrospira sp.]
MLKAGSNLFFGFGSVLFILGFLVSCGDEGGGRPPSAPTGLVATPGDDQVTLSWSPVSDASSYTLHTASTDWAMWSLTLPGATQNSILTCCSFPNIGLTNGAIYWFAVSAVNANGESSESVHVSAVPSPAGDPLFLDQWHLQNTGQGGGTPGQDLNVVPVWNSGLKGEGIRIVVVDDGLEIAHEDLAANIASGLSHNYCDSSSDPTLCGSDTTASEHGTAVAGIISARDLDGVGGRGVAPRASTIGYNLLESTIISNQADAMTRNGSSVDISNNSWGAPDFTGLLKPTSVTWRDAILTGLSTGRSGKGTIYVFAAGNGGLQENSNYDGYANNRGVMAICAVGDDGHQAFYSEQGANLWVCAPSGGNNGHSITTTDRTGSLGYNTHGTSDYPNTNYTNTFAGTSASVPMASGVVALMLQANPNLGWRDIRLILAQTARKNNPADPGWTTNGAGKNINHKYGFGVINAEAAVNTAMSWTNLVPEQPPHTTPLATPALSIPDNNPTGVSDTITVTGSGITSIEFIEVTFSADDHTYFGDLEITLTNNTTGTVSRLAETHACTNADTGASIICQPSYNGWVFGTVRHLDESADGSWTLKVKDLAPEDTGKFQSWQLKFYGR